MAQSALKAWIEAMRPRTLPVSIAGVLAGCAVAIMYRSFRPLPALICLLFALGAQIASNFANEYYDFKGGIDSKGREGFRRGVTEGDISPRAMKHATYGVLVLACLLGCSLIWWGGWGLIPVGMVIALFALGYSTGPWPLSHHGLGDVAVVIFFGIVPVTLTAWLQCGSWTLPAGEHGQPMWLTALLIGIAAGLLAANVLIVNNYRDMESDFAVGKRTTVVIFGRTAMRRVYLANILIAICLMIAATARLSHPDWIPSVWIIFGALAPGCYERLKRSRGKQLNKVLGATARLMLAAILVLLILSFFTV